MTLEINFSRISNKTFLGRFLRLPLKLLPKNLIVPVLQGKLKGSHWIIGSSNHGCWLGSFEQEKRKLFEITIKKGSVVFDLGANVGFYTLLASKLVGNLGKVYSFEPVPSNLNYLKKHIRLNKCSNVTVFETAISDFNGQANFNTTNNASTGFISSDGELTINVESLDNLISENKVPSPDYIKIDIEGGELKALNGAINILRTSKPTVFLATHSKSLHEDCCNLLISLGYKLLPIGNNDINSTDEIVAIANNN